MGLFDFFKPKPLKDENKKTNKVYAYDESQYNEVEQYVEKNFGEIKSVVHEPYAVSMHITGMHVDVAIIPPTKESNYYKLVTIGAGSYKMNVPEGLKNTEFERAEFVMYMPADWDFGIDTIKVVDKKDWPINVLKRFARMSMMCESWISVGHTMSLDAENTHFSEDTDLCSALCLPAIDKEGKRMYCNVPGLGKINFYVMAALYEEELFYVMKNGANAILDKFEKNKIGLVVDTKRKNCAKD